MPSPLIFSLLFLCLLPSLSPLPNPDPAPLQQQQIFHPTLSPPPSTIPSFPEQSAVTAAGNCHVTLPTALVSAVNSACSGKPHLNPLTCCPVLSAWIYSAYAPTALGGAQRRPETTSLETMPVLPDDTEGCVEGVEREMREKGVDLVRPNASCDVVYCYCGIRLRELRCPEVVGGERVKRLERDCLNRNGNGGVHRCSKCLLSLSKLRKEKTGNSTRSGKMQMRDCELMGLTWLLNKNRDAYIHTVVAVMRALMIDPDGSDPRSCRLNRDGMPLAVDSSQINGQSSSSALQLSLLLSFCWLLMSFISVLNGLF